MATWHAYASRPVLLSGTEILVTGGHDRVRLRTTDRLSIEMPDNNRLSAVVVDRTGDRLQIAVAGSPRIALEPTTGNGAFEDFKLSDWFSRESWTVR